MARVNDLCKWLAPQNESVLIYSLLIDDLYTLRPLYNVTNAVIMLSSNSVQL